MEKTTKNGIHRITQAGGKTIAWAEESGVKVLEKDGYYFKDLAKTGELLPYEDWRLSDEERAADLASPSEPSNTSPCRPRPRVTSRLTEGLWEGKPMPNSTPPSVPPSEREMDKPSSICLT